MKKLAIFVEGPTEADFIELFLKEIISIKRINLICLYNGSGGGQSSLRPRIFVPEKKCQFDGTEYEIHIYCSQNDERVNSDILERSDALKTKGFSQIIGIRDLRGGDNTQDDLPKYKSKTEAIKDLLKKKGCAITLDLIIAVMEVETWFIGECNHYLRINPTLTQSYISANIAKLTESINPFSDKLEDIDKPAEYLDSIYKLVGLSYKKDKKHRNRTIDALDMEAMYIDLPKRSDSFKELTLAIDSFL